MPRFKHACFLSYRHGQQSIKERFIRQLHDGLAAELELLRQERVYVDYERLSGGQFLDPNIARALADSACMIAVYHPTYFDPEHLYCAREYLAMLTLEENRLDALGPGAERENGLIIPIILRGSETLPAEIAKRRIYHDFSKVLLGDVDAGIKGHAAQLRGIAQYIDGRCRALESVRADSVSLQLPDDQTVREWIRTLELPDAKFPGTGAINRGD